MNELLKMDIFFAVATFAVLAVGVVFAIILIRAWRILDNIERISKNAAEESDALRADIGNLRAKVRTGMRLGYLSGLFSSFFRERNLRKKK